MDVQADVWYKQPRLGEARSEVLGAADVYEKLRATADLEICRNSLRAIEEEMKLTTYDEPDSDGELPDTVLILVRVDIPLHSSEDRIAALIVISFRGPPRPQCPLTPPPVAFSNITTPLVPPHFLPFQNIISSMYLPHSRTSFLFVPAPPSWFSVGQ